MYEDRLVVFIDILGFKEAIKDSAICAERFSQIYDFLKLYSSTSHINETFDGFRRGDGAPCDDDDLKNLKETYEYSFTQFSDSFVFSVKTSNIQASQYLPLLVAKFTKRAFDIGFLVRGGLSKGDMIHEDSGPAFGPAFIEAYQLESRQAVFARTVVSANAFNFLKEAGKFCTNWIDDGYDGVKEITVPSFIRELNWNNEERRAIELQQAIIHLEKLKGKIPERDKEICNLKYNYVYAKLIDATLMPSAKT